MSRRAFKLLGLCTPKLLLIPLRKISPLLRHPRAFGGDLLAALVLHLLHLHALLLDALAHLLLRLLALLLEHLRLVDARLVLIGWCLVSWPRWAIRWRRGAIGRCGRARRGSLVALSKLEMICAI